MNTPSSFTSPFLQARAVRHGRHPAPVKTGAQEAGTTIPWREFVQAVFELPEGWDYHGDIPEGISSQQFWSRVNRAAKQATRVERGQSMSKLNHAKVGIITRGQRFWVWAVTIPAKRDKSDRITNQKRGWIGRLMLKLRDGEPVEIDHELNKKERTRLRERALRRGWRLHIGKTKEGASRVQLVEEK